MECWPSFELNRLHVVASKRYVQFFVLRVTTIGSNMQWPRWNGLKRPLNRGLLSGAVSVLGGVHVNYWSIQAIICRNLPPPLLQSKSSPCDVIPYFLFLYFSSMTFVYAACLRSFALHLSRLTSYHICVVCTSFLAGTTQLAWQFGPRPAMCPKTWLTSATTTLWQDFWEKLYQGVRRLIPGPLASGPRRNLYSLFVY